MTDPAISFETYDLAISKGYHEEVFDENFKVSTTQSELQRWLRDHKRIVMFVQPKGMKYHWTIYLDDFKNGEHGYTLHEKWEEAMEEGLKTALNLIP